MPGALRARPQAMTRSQIRRHRYAVATAAMTWLLLIAGAMVTSTDSGLAVPDWPLSYGTWFPPMVGGIIYEHGHRLIAGVVAFLILGLAVWLWMAEPRRWVRLLGTCALGGVCLQALLGGLTVLWLLPPLVSIGHACLGQGVFCAVVALAHATAPGWSQGPARRGDCRSSSMRILGLAVAALSAGQLVLGAIIRHTGLMVGAHMITALLLAAATLWLLIRVVCVRPVASNLRARAWWLTGSLGAQLVLGLAVFQHRGAVAVRTGHVACGALILAQAVVLAWELFRGISPGASARFLQPNSPQAPG